MFYATKLVECSTKYELYGSARCSNIIVGYLKLPKINWVSLTCSSSDKVHSLLLRHVIESSYCQIHDNNILDVVLANDASIVTNVRSDLRVGFSDRIAVKYDLTLPAGTQYVDPYFCSTGN